MLQEIDGVVYDVSEVETNTQTAIVRTHHCFARKLAIEGDNTVAVNAELELTIKLYDWQDQPVTDEPKEVTVQVSGQETVLNLVSGEAVFDFISETVGVFKISAMSSNCDEAIFEVTVNE